MVKNRTQVTMPADIGGKKRTLYFNVNTFGAFEGKANKFFLDFVANLQEALDAAKEMRDESGKIVRAADPMRLFRSISIRDIHAFVWAAMHEYDEQGEPFWTVTLGQLGKLLDIETLATLLPGMVYGASQNMPDPSDSARPTEPTADPPSAASTRVDGGTASGPLDEDVLASMTLKSED